MDSIFYVVGIFVLLYMAFRMGKDYEKDFPRKMGKVRREHKWEYNGKHLICSICGLLKSTYTISGKNPRLECEALKPTIKDEAT